MQVAELLPAWAELCKQSQVVVMPEMRVMLGLHMKKRQCLPSQMCGGGGKALPERCCLTNPADA